MSSGPENFQQVARLTGKFVKSLKVGINFISAGTGEGVDCPGPEIPLILFVDPSDGHLSAYKNQCRHNGGKFAAVGDIEDLAEAKGKCSEEVKCTMHGWKLNCRTGKYTNPPDSLEQEKLKVVEENGDFLISQRSVPRPWLENPGKFQTTENRPALKPKELSVRYISHACVSIEAGGVSLVSDPWLTGPAFGRGWWLSHEPHQDSYQQVAAASGIYISHRHPDHLNIPTMKRIAAINPHVPIFVADLSVPILGSAEFQGLGFTNIHRLKLGEWHYFNENTRFMILPDTLYPHLDTCLFFQYRGYSILNLVDCCFPHYEILPKPVDLLLTDFASGASGFPSCFPEQFGEDRLVELANGKARQFLKKTYRHVILTGARSWIPFAGYFTEAHPDDRAVQMANQKNSPEFAAQFLTERIPSLATWLPFPNGKFDLFDLRGEEPGEAGLTRSSFLKKSWNFQPYTDQLAESMDFLPLQTLAGVGEYFQWAGFSSYSLILHVIECSDDFKQEIREFYVDFSSSLESLEIRPGRPVYPSERPKDVESSPATPVFRMRVRSSVFRDCLVYGHSWDNLYIGFSGRFYAEPNVYHQKLWDKFLNQLPEGKPTFKGENQGKPEETRKIPPPMKTDGKQEKNQISWFFPVLFLLVALFLVSFFR